MFILELKNSIDFNLNIITICMTLPGYQVILVHV